MIPHGVEVFVGLEPIDLRWGFDRLTGHILSLFASAPMHGLDAEAYLRDIVRVLAHWPNDRYLELAPLFWRQTRDRLDPVELEREIGVLTVPPRLPTTQQQAAAG